MTQSVRTRNRTKRLPLRRVAANETLPLRAAILEEEKRLHNIVMQCGPEADSLFASFRFDEICRALTQFHLRGLSLKTLFSLQRCLPVVYPWNLEYDTLRQDANRRLNVFPLMIVMTKTKQDVVRSFKFSRKYNIEVVPRSGAHSAEGWSLNEGIVIDQSRRTKMDLDTQTGVCKFEAGC
jgi:hypothetical protein